MRNATQPVPGKKTASRFGGSAKAVFLLGLKPNSIHNGVSRFFGFI